MPRILLISCAVIWGWTFVATRICLQFVTPLELLGLRLLIAVPALYAIVRARRLRFEFTAAEARRTLLAGAIVTAHFLIQIYGLKYTSATNTGWIIAVAPLAMAVLAFLFLGERIGQRTMIGILVATTGILLLISQGRVAQFDWLSSVGDWLVLLSAHTWALYTIAVRDLSRSRNPLVVTVAVFAPPALIIPAVMLFNSDWRHIAAMSTEAWVALAFLGLFGMALAQWFWQKGVSQVGAARAGMYLYLEPLATTALAVPYLGEYFGWTSALGGALVLAGVYWASRRHHKATAAPATAD
ncbi:MAG TPA: DMT family transporter [candidate division Zixibacteria bacterium]|nr:DMT family transporter [candidate division Zixibacteria bacterium]